MGLRQQTLPRAWVALPVLGACFATIAASILCGPLPALLIACIAGVLAAFAIDRRVRVLRLAAGKIASGDRYAVLPGQPSGPLADLAFAIHALRETVIQADALAIDQRRREAEARLHFAGRGFFTKRFRGAVEEVMTAFTTGSGRIGNTASDLAERNDHMDIRVANAAAAEQASADIHAVADAARVILARIKHSIGDISASRQAGERAATGDDVAEFYTPFNHKNWEGTVAWIKRFGAGGDAAIVTTVSGDANIYLYRELARQGISADTIPAMTLSIGESELAAIAGPEIEGHLPAWSYLHEIDAPENRTFIAAWRKFCGAPNVVTDDPMEATWIGFNLWREAVQLEDSIKVADVRRALAGLRIRAPSGFDVVMDLTNHHLHKPAVIGRITADARIVPVWTSDGLIAPSL